MPCRSIVLPQKSDFRSYEPQARDYASLVLIAVADPPALPRVPVVSNVLIGVAPPSRTRMNRERSAKYTLVNASEVSSATLSM